MRYNGHYGRLILGLRQDRGFRLLSVREISAETMKALTGGSLSSVGEKRNGLLRVRLTGEDGWSVRGFVRAGCWLAGLAAR